MKKHYVIDLKFTINNCDAELACSDIENIFAISKLLASNIPASCYPTIKIKRGKNNENFRSDRNKQ